MTSPKSLINHKWNFRCICHVIFFFCNSLQHGNCNFKIPAYFSKSYECWSRRLETGCVFEAMPFSSEAPVAGCSFVSQSIHPALHLHHHSSPATQQEEEEDINTVCVCMCMNVTAFVSKRSISVHAVCELFLCLSLLHAEKCVCVCVIVHACMSLPAHCDALLLLRHPCLLFVQAESTSWFLRDRWEKKKWLGDHTSFILTMFRSSLSRVSSRRSLFGFFSLLSAFLGFIYPYPVSLFYSPSFLLTDVNSFHFPIQ